MKNNKNYTTKKAHSLIEVIADSIVPESLAPATKKSSEDDFSHLLRNTKGYLQGSKGFDKGKANLFFSQYRESHLLQFQIANEVNITFLEQTVKLKDLLKTNPSSPQVAELYNEVQSLVSQVLKIAEMPGNSDVKLFNTARLAQAAVQEKPQVKPLDFGNETDSEIKKTTQNLLSEIVKDIDIKQLPQEKGEQKGLASDIGSAAFHLTGNTNITAGGARVFLQNYGIRDEDNEFKKSDISDTQLILLKNAVELRNTLENTINPDWSADVQRKANALNQELHKVKSIPEIDEYSFMKSVAGKSKQQQNVEKATASGTTQQKPANGSSSFVEKVGKSTTHQHQNSKDALIANDPTTVENITKPSKELSGISFSSARDFFRSVAEKVGLGKVFGI